MRFVKSSASEYLVIGRRGRLVSRGTAASALLWPGATAVIIPTTNHEATFEMTQESRDGIPLRFKGLVIYRVADPVATAAVFDFDKPGGHDEIKRLISQVCLGELRHAVAALAMEDCMEQRKTTLSEAVAVGLRAVAENGARPWGIALELVQIAQVFVVDAEIRAKLEAERRSELGTRSARSEIEMKQQIRQAQLAADARLHQAQLETERGKAEADRERIRLQRELEVAAIEAEVPVKQLRARRRIESLQQEIELRRLENQLRALEVEGELVGERARQDMRREILPLEQAPAIAASLAEMLRNTHLSVYGGDAQVVGALAPAIDLLVAKVRASTPGR